MKYLIFLLACSFASPLFLQENPLFLQDNLGESCLKNPNFNFTSFTVQYWPIYLGIPYSLIFSGVFTSEELLDQITVGIRREGHTWDYSFFNYNQNFKKGDYSVHVFIEESKGLLPVTSDKNFNPVITVKCFDKLKCTRKLKNVTSGATSI